MKESDAIFFFLIYGGGGVSQLRPLSNRALELMNINAAVHRSDT